MTKKSLSSGLTKWRDMSLKQAAALITFYHRSGASLMNEKMRQLSLMDMKIGHSWPFPHRNRRPMPLAFALIVSIREAHLNFENSKCKLTNGKGRVDRE